MWLGVALWLAGNAGAVVADRQLARWRGDPANGGKTMRGGLWSWSRHPNYFFEWLTWMRQRARGHDGAVGLDGVDCPRRAARVLLFRVTGIPATEAQAMRGRTDYEEYRRTTSVFVPLPPRR